MRLQGAFAIAAAPIAVLGVGCGGGAGLVSAPEPPAECVREWNGGQASTLFGRHVHREHGSSQGQAVRLEPGDAAPAVRGRDTCAVVFAVPVMDEEYGDVGLVQTRFGWASMKELDRGDPERLASIQEQAGLAPNVTLFPDGTISPR